MIIYLDSDYRCYAENSGSMRPIETDIFEGKCAAFVEGYRFVPQGETWVDDKGRVYTGGTLVAVDDYPTLLKFQAQHEADDSARLADLGIPQEQDYVATRNYPVDAFIGIYGQLYEVIRSIPAYSSIVLGQNVIKTTVEHYLDTLKEGE